ncbi:SMI1/KNR4 family protein [Acanthopleuribacter pedis]|uniref:SMI1/KNR4 family protein n=1 Tax=Acanthopleuribacter pedis TaxID=442870 RepID=A0A8J7QD05_9BACT|nr:SMI1/KNR4 family protein [Acanthopleuribacter pedis]MBO1321864.1 SMI1/KNR4 family protein [Acanthopleuribacter pedis]
MNQDALQRMIQYNPDIVTFRDPREGVPDTWIQKAEQAIGIELSRSYKWWLKNYGSGRVGKEPIYSINDPEADPTKSVDILSMFHLYKLPNRRIPICHSDVEGVFSLAPDEVTAPGEYAVYSEALKGVYALTFSDFLEKRIKAYLVHDR